MEAKQAVMKCAHCKEELVDESVKRRGKDYCCEACAFEAARVRCCDPDQCLYSYDATCR